jgi:hypothetical protein
MCLLVHQPASTSFSNDFLADVYSGNRDGIGAMYALGGQLHVVKALPKNADEFIEFYRQHVEGRESIWHARMQTHGDVDLENCHPYQVTARVALAHNGILATGNAWDAARSDTWHFIRNIVRPAVASDEAIVLDPSWQSFIGDLIGVSNKFGMMTADGQAVIINRKAGVTFQGAWLSNTYAWSAHRFGVGSAISTRYSSSRVWSTYYWEDEDAGSSVKRSRSVSGQDLVTITRAARNSYVRGSLAQWVQDAPGKAAALVNAIEDDSTGESGLLAWDEPELVVEAIADWFELEEGLPRGKSAAILEDDPWAHYGFQD